ncbi:Ferric reduction oxidase 5 [Diplonema papillatum]|nr:Ferric reduction oxidase 5 [Diplonema papillatum]
MRLACICAALAAASVQGSVPMMAVPMMRSNGADFGNHDVAHPHPVEAERYGEVGHHGEALAALGAGSTALSGEFTASWDLTTTELVLLMRCHHEHFCAIALAGGLLGSDISVSYSEGKVSSWVAEPDLQNVTMLEFVRGDGDADPDIQFITFSFDLSQRGYDASVSTAGQRMVWATGRVEGGFVLDAFTGVLVLDWSEPSTIAPSVAPTAVPAPVPLPTLVPGSSGETNHFGTRFGMTWEVTPSDIIISMVCDVDQYCAIALGSDARASDTMVCYYGGTVLTSVNSDDDALLDDGVTEADSGVEILFSGRGDIEDTWVVTFKRPLQESDKTLTQQNLVWITGRVEGGIVQDSTRGKSSMDWVGAEPSVPIITLAPETPAPVTPVPVPEAKEITLHSVDSSFEFGIQLFRSSDSLAAVTSNHSGTLLADEPAPDSARFTILCETGRYCSVGLNDDGRMTRSDVFMCYESAVSGTPVCIDWLCTEREACPADPSQDIVMESAEAEGGMFAVTFTRLLDTGDARDNIIAPDLIGLIYASGDADGKSPQKQHDVWGAAVLVVATDDLIFTREDDGYWQVLAALGCLVLLGLVSGAVFYFRPVFGYFLLQTWLGAAVSMVFIGAAFLMVMVGDFMHYDGRLARAAMLWGGPAQLCVALAIVLKCRLVSPCWFLMSLPQSRALPWHRWIVRLGWVFTTLHMIVVLAKYSTGPQGASAMFEQELATGFTTDAERKVRPLAGFIGWLFYTLFVVAGTPIIRRMNYRVFETANVALSVATVICTIVHLPYGWRSYVIFGAPIALLLADCVARILQQTRSAHIVSCDKTDTVAKIVIQTENVSWGPGSYFYLSVPQVGFAEQHPFSVATKDSDNKAVFYVKNMGRGSWTDRLVSLPFGPSDAVPVRMEGPYGSLTFDYKAYDKLVLIAGGIGVTPMLSLLRSLEPEKSAVLVWTVHDPNLVRFVGEELRELTAARTGFHAIMHYTGLEMLEEVSGLESRQNDSIAEQRSPKLARRSWEK